MAVDPPRPKPPPLTALRAFEAAARLGGFSRAAEELAVTAGAVSQQVRALEDWAGAKLFERQAQGVVLTASGARILPMLSDSFDQLGRATQMLQDEAGLHMRIAALPAVAQLWLAPRLTDLRKSDPRREISVTALERPPNLLREPFSFSLFLMPEGQGVKLTADILMPVCAPGLAAALHSPEDLMQVPWLIDTSWRSDWRVWLEGVGLTPPLRPQGAQFSLYAIAVQEAIAGAGVLMAHLPLVQPWLDNGTLVAPFDIPVATEKALCVLTPDGMSRTGRDRLVGLLQSAMPAL